MTGSKLTLLALAAAAVLVATPLYPAAAQSMNTPVSKEELRGSEFDQPQYSPHSWGILYAPFDGPQISYSWTEVRQRLDRARQVRISSADGRWSGQPVPQEMLRGTAFADPLYVRHSWGFMFTPFDGPQVSYSWAEVRRALSGTKG